ncbi:MAG: class I SAM-dependent methyltransferase [Candidatus Thorarchaeota archaeon]|jgi:SAM-dependent methyltransferase
MNYCNPEGFRNEIRQLKEAGDIDAFYHWFDGGDTMEGAFKKGADVFNRVILPYAKKYISKRVKTGTALDLGYGAGTKIQAAISHFSKVYGVDVHEEFDFILENIKVPDEKEVVLVKGDGDTLVVANDEIDFVYSWVTLCHVGTIDAVKKYLEETHRVLKDGGLAVLFFTRLVRSGKRQKWHSVLQDIQDEMEDPDGYREGGPLSRVRTINLVVSMWKMEELAKEVGLDVVDRTASWDSERGKTKVYHGQYGIVLQKPQPKKKKLSSRRKKSE